MPEGDTIFRTARTLQRDLGGRVLTAVQTRVPQLRARGEQRLVGQTVAAVEPRGKHLLMWFAPSDLALHTHMMMSGSWHTYAPGQRWRKHPRSAKVVLHTADAVAVCFAAPIVELLSRAEVGRHRLLSALGPDALSGLAEGGSARAPDLAAARRRLDADPGRPIGLALLDQQVLAGVGNVFRCEALFIHGLDPWSAVATVADRTRDALLDTCVRLLTANADAQMPLRITTGATPGGPAPAWPPGSPLRRGPQPRHYVYGRAGRACVRCAAPIRVARQGPQARSTFWCPRCQGSGPPPRA